MNNSDQIYLDSFNENDSSILFKWNNDREQVHFNAPYKPVHEIQHRTWFESIQQRNDIVIFAIRLQQSGELIGSCQLHHINTIHRSAEMQIRLGDISKRGLGYGTKATNLLLNFAFNDLNLYRVYLHVLSVVT